MLALTAGCLGPLGEDGGTFEAERATVPDSTLEETGYEEAAVASVEIERSFEVGDQGQTVEIINWQAEYDRSVDLGPLGDARAAVFTALSTPRVDLLGRTFNPVADMSTRDLVEMVQERYDDIGEIDEDETGSVTILGEETARTRFTGTGTLAAGAEVDIYLHVTEAVTSGGDLVLAIGVHPQELADEEDAALAMMERIEHETG